MSKLINEINKLYKYLNYLSLKPEFGGPAISSPERRQSVQNEIKALENKLQAA